MLSKLRHMYFYNLDLIQGRGLKGWTAYQLVKVAERLWCSETYSRIQIVAPDGGKVVEMIVAEDAYGSGVWSWNTPLRSNGYQYNWVEYTPEEFTHWLDTDEDPEGVEGIDSADPMIKVQAGADE